MTLVILGDVATAEEVMQDVFLDVWQDFEMFDPSRGSLRSWLIALARNTAIDRLRLNSERQRRREGRGLESPCGNIGTYELHLDDVLRVETYDMHLHN